jgi:hypothetical protein
VWGKPPMTGDEKPPSRNWPLDPVRPRVALAAPTIAFVVAPFAVWEFPHSGSYAIRLASPAIGTAAVKTAQFPNPDWRHLARHSSDAQHRSALAGAEAAQLAFGLARAGPPVLSSCPALPSGEWLRHSP